MSAALDTVAGASLAGCEQLPPAEEGASISAVPGFTPKRGANYYPEEVKWIA